MTLLTDEEIDTLDDNFNWGELPRPFIPARYRFYFSQAQIKKIHDWGNEKCTEHYLGKGHDYHHLKRDCDKCWESLLKGE